MCLHENIRNQSSHRDFQSVNLKCQLKEIQNFIKGMNLETLLKKYSYCPLCPTFSNPHYTSDWLVCQSLIMSAFQKPSRHKLKLQFDLEKTPSTSHAMPMLPTATILNSRLFCWFFVSYVFDLFWGLLSTTLVLFSHQVWKVSVVSWFAGRNVNSAHF